MKLWMVLLFSSFIASEAIPRFSKSESSNAFCEWESRRRRSGFSKEKGAGLAPNDNVYSLVGAAPFRIISSISLGVTIKGSLGKCRIFPVIK